MKHPGQSLNYKRKMQIWKKRTSQREALRLAKSIFDEIFEEKLPNKKRIIANIKRDIVKGIM